MLVVVVVGALFLLRARAAACWPLSCLSAGRKLNIQ